MIYNVKNFGAAGDGIHKDQAAIQKAIDTAAAEGGGRIEIPQGTYLTGTIYLRSHVDIDLQPGAVILASPDKEDYNAPDAWPQNWTSVIEKADGRHLIAGVEVSYVTISGGGRIDGNQAAFFDPTKYSRTDFPGTRPSQMVYFVESDHIALDNLELVYAAYWTCFLYGCDDVRIHAVTTRNNPLAWNTDSLDIDSCRRVVVSDCNLDGADDCIAIRGSIRDLKDKTRACEDITVTNCVLNTRQGGVRLGVGNGAIRRVCISNLCMKNAGYGIVILSSYFDSAVQDMSARPKGDPDYGTTVEDVLIDNIYMNARNPIMIMSNNNGHPIERTNTRLRNITIRGIRGTGWCSCLIQGNHDSSVQNINLSQIDLRYHGGSQIVLLKPGENCTARYPYFRPYAIYAANVDGLTLDRVNISWERIDGPWTHALVAANVPKLRLIDCELQAPPDGSSKAIYPQWQDNL